MHTHTRAHLRVRLRVLPQRQLHHMPRARQRHAHSGVQGQQQDIHVAALHESLSNTRRMHTNRVRVCVCVCVWSPASL